MEHVVSARPDTRRLRCRAWWLTALTIGWRLSHQGEDHAASERAERRAVRLIALSFLAIAAYVAYDAIARLAGARAGPASGARWDWSSRRCHSW